MIKKQFVLTGFEPLPDGGLLPRGVVIAGPVRYEVYVSANALFCIINKVPETLSEIICSVNREESHGKPTRYIVVEEEVPVFERLVGGTLEKIEKTEYDKEENPIPW